MKTHTKKSIMLFFLMYQSSTIEGSKPTTANSTKSARQVKPKSSASQAQSKEAPMASVDDIGTLINNFVTTINTIDPKNKKTFDALTKRAYKLLPQIKTFIAQHPDKISKEQLDSLNTAVKKMPKQSTEVNKKLDDIIASIQNAATKSPENMQIDIQKAQQLIAEMQADLEKNPNLAASKEKKEAIEQALKKLPKRSQKLDKFLAEFKRTVQAIPTQGSANFNGAVMNAVTADKQLLNFLKTEKPMMTKDQGESIKSLVQEFKAKLPTMTTVAK